MRFLGAALLLSVLVACAPKIPDSGAGVDDTSFEGYDDSSTYRRTTDPAPAPVADAPPAEATASSGGPAADASTAGVVPAATASTQTRGISDEQDFTAVSDRETIESDAQRLAENRENYQVVQPTAVPTRSSEGPNIFAYAANTENPIGQKIYRRSLLSTQGRSARACARYASDDLAQEAFLSEGGPERDRLNLDPDGDGYACGWDPRPYRRAAAVAASSR